MISVREGGYNFDLRVAPARALMKALPTGRV